MKELNLWFKNYYALTPFMWFSLTSLFHSRNCYEYHGMINNDGCMQIFDE